MKTGPYAPLLLVSVALLSCEGSSESGSGSPLSTESSTLDFGEVLIGDSRTLSVTVRNADDTFHEVTSAELSADSSAEFAITSGYERIDLAPGAEIAFEVEYGPTDEGADFGTLLVTVGGEDFRPLSISLLASGSPVPAQEIEVTPESLDFGEVVIGTSSALAATIENVGSAALEVTRISFSIDTSGDFTSPSSFAGGSVAPGARVAFDIDYTPGDEGSDAGELIVESDDADEPQIVISLAGSGALAPAPGIQVSPRSVDFGEVLIGSARALAVTVSNTGTANLEVSDFRLGAGVSSEFELSSMPASVSIAPGSRLDVDVTYAPVDESADSGTLRFESDDPDEELVIVSLSGAGAPAPAPDILVSPPALDFGEILVGSDAALEVSVRNIGSAPLTVSRVELGGGTSPAFRLSSPPGFTLDPMESRTATIIYTPDHPSADTGSLRIESDDADDALVIVSLSGSGSPVPRPEIAVDPESLAFGDVLVGDARALSLSILNTGGAPLTIDSVGLGGGTSVDYTVSSRLADGTVIEAAGSRTVEVTFAPTAEGPATGALRIASDDVDEPLLIVPISGDGTPAPVSPVTLTWEAPTVNEDGSPLEDLAGFRIQIGETPGEYTQFVDVGNRTTRVLDFLPSGTHYIAVTAYDFAANESTPSREVVVMVP